MHMSLWMRCRLVERNASYQVKIEATDPSETIDPREITHVRKRLNLSPKRHKTQHILQRRLRHLSVQYDCSRWKSRHAGQGARMAMDQTLSQRTMRETTTTGLLWEHRQTQAKRQTNRQTEHTSTYQNTRILKHIDTRHARIKKEE